MELILVRHGQAAAQGIDAGDASRPLTERGHLQARAVGAVLANTGPQPVSYTHLTLPTTPYV